MYKPVMQQASNQEVVVKYMKSIRSQHITVKHPMKFRELKVFKKFLNPQNEKEQ